MGEETAVYLRTAMCYAPIRPNVIFFMLHCGAKPQNCGLALSCFPLDDSAKEGLTQFWEVFTVISYALKHLQTLITS